MTEEDEKQEDTTTEEIEANSSIMGQIAHQKAEQGKTRYPSIEPFFFDYINELDTKAGAHIRMLRDQLIAEYEALNKKNDKNNGEVTFDQLQEIQDKLLKDKINIAIEKAFMEHETVTTLYKERKAKGVDSDFILKETYGHTLKNLGSPMRVLTALMDDDVLPLIPKRTISQTIRLKIQEEVEEELNEEDEVEEESKEEK